MPSFNFLVIGSGIAGLTYALRVAGHGTVCVITKKSETDSNTNYAQGGVASVFAEGDSFAAHVADTLAAGAGLSHLDAVEAMVSEGPALVEELFRLGVSFSLSDTRHFDLGNEGGHSRRRIVHARDYTGFEIERTLAARARQHPNVTILEHHLAIDLIGGHTGRCLGAYVLDTASGGMESYAAGSVLLATGGIGQVYLHTTNPLIATGDGIAMARRAGAAIANMEFVQFHPTTLYQDQMDPSGRSFLISEAVRGEGGVLRTLAGRAFMPDYHQSADLAPRDVVARAIDSELKASGDSHVLLDISKIGLDRFRQRFPNITQGCAERGIDLATQSIPVVPAAHYICGGVRTDLQGRTDLPGLYAAGETACTGVHGANRLASNSLLEALVFAARAARTAVEERMPARDVPQWDYVGSVPSREKVVVYHNRLAIRQLMWNYVGIVRSDKRLARAAGRLAVINEEISDYYWKYRVGEELAELRNLATIAGLAIGCATQRQESRGLHYNEDHPQRDDANWMRDTIVGK